MIFLGVKKEAVQFTTLLGSLFCCFTLTAYGESAATRL